MRRSASPARIALRLAVLLSVCAALASLAVLLRLPDRSPAAEVAVDRPPLAPVRAAALAKPPNAQVTGVRKGNNWPPQRNGKLKIAPIPASPVAVDRVLPAVKNAVPPAPVAAAAPVISVVVAWMEGASGVRTLASSVRQQGFPAYEIFVVNGDPLRSADFARAYEAASSSGECAVWVNGTSLEGLRQAPSNCTAFFPYSARGSLCCELEGIECALDCGFRVARGLWMLGIDADAELDPSFRASVDAALSVAGDDLTTAYIDRRYIAIAGSQGKGAAPAAGPKGKVRPEQRRFFSLPEGVPSFALLRRDVVRGMAHALSPPPPPPHPHPLRGGIVVRPYVLFGWQWWDVWVRALRTAPGASVLVVPGAIVKRRMPDGDQCVPGAKVCSLLFRAANADVYGTGYALAAITELAKADLFDKLPSTYRWARALNAIQSSRKFEWPPSATLFANLRTLALSAGPILPAEKSTDSLEGALRDALDIAVSSNRQGKDIPAHPHERLALGWLSSVFPPDAHLAIPEPSQVAETRRCAHMDEVILTLSQRCDPSNVAMFFGLGESDRGNGEKNDGAAEDAVAKAAEEAGGEMKEGAEANGEGGPMGAGDGERDGRQRRLLSAPSECRVIHMLAGADYRLKARRIAAVRAVASAFKHHPDAVVIVHYESSAGEGVGGDDWFREGLGAALADAFKDFAQVRGDGPPVPRLIFMPTCLEWHAARAGVEELAEHAKELSQVPYRTMAQVHSQALRYEPGGANDNDEQPKELRANKLKELQRGPADTMVVYRYLLLQAYGGTAVDADFVFVQPLPRWPPPLAVEAFYPVPFDLLHRPTEWSGSLEIGVVVSVGSPRPPSLTLMLRILNLRAASARAATRTFDGALSAPRAPETVEDLMKAEKLHRESAVWLATRVRGALLVIREGLRGTAERPLGAGGDHGDTVLAGLRVRTTKCPSVMLDGVAEEKESAAVPPTLDSFIASHLGCPLSRAVPTVAGEAYDLSGDETRRAAQLAHPRTFDGIALSIAAQACPENVKCPALTAGYEG